MRAQGSGVILMTASTNGTEGHPFYADYNASKAGVILLAKTMALELAPAVRVNAVCPGYVLTPDAEGRIYPRNARGREPKIPMKRHADPAEVAALFAFLASSEAAYITGAEICIDGGETAGPRLRTGTGAGLAGSAIFSRRARPGPASTERRRLRARRRAS